MPRCFRSRRYSPVVGRWCCNAVRPSGGGARSPRNGSISPSPCRRCWARCSTAWTCPRLLISGAGWPLEFRWPCSATTGVPGSTHRRVDSAPAPPARWAAAGNRGGDRGDVARRLVAHRRHGAARREGYLRVVDRKSGVIIIGGLNVHPCEIEDVLAGGLGVRRRRHVRREARWGGHRVRGAEAGHDGGRGTRCRATARAAPHPWACRGRRVPAHHCRRQGGREATALRPDLVVW